MGEFYWRKYISDWRQRKLIGVKNSRIGATG